MYGIRRMKGGCWRLLCDMHVAGTLARHSGNDPTQLYGKTAAELQLAPFHLYPEDAARAATALERHQRGEMI